MNRKSIILIRVLAIVVLLAGLSAPFAQAAGPRDGEEDSKALPGWRQVNVSGFGDPGNLGVTTLEKFKGYLYAGASNWNTGGSVWRSKDGLSWEIVSEPGFGEVYTNTNPAVIDMIKYKDRLYVGVGWPGTGVTGVGQIWRTFDGTTWEQVEGSGFGDPNNNSITNFIMFGNMLYGSAGNEVTGVQIWRSPTGDPASWTNVVSDGFGYPANRQVTGFIKFKGLLYAAIESNILFGPAQVWRSSDGLHWSPVTVDGFGDLDNYSTGGFAIFKNYLYLGTRNDVTGAQLWRSKDGLSWTKVIGDGFGDITNNKIESLFTYKAKLYTVTQNFVTGAEVWRTSNGKTWLQVNLDGFGDSNNNATLWSNATAVYKSRLFIGTWNAVDGGEIWEMLSGKK